MARSRGGLRNGDLAQLSWGLEWEGERLVLGPAGQREGCSQPQGPPLLLRTSPGPRDLRSSPRSASSCSVTVSQSPPLGPQFAYLDSERLSSDSDSQRLEFLLLSPRASTVSHTGPAGRGFPLKEETGNALREEERPDQDHGWQGEGAWRWIRGWRKSLEQDKGRRANGLCEDVEREKGLSRSKVQETGSLGFGDSGDRGFKWGEGSDEVVAHISVWDDSWQSEFFD